jgi:hypothetical protein
MDGLWFRRRWLTSGLWGRARSAAGINHYERGILFFELVIQQEAIESGSLRSQRHSKAWRRHVGAMGPERNLKAAAAGSAQGGADRQGNWGEAMME